MSSTLFARRGHITCFWLYLFPAIPKAALRASPFSKRFFIEDLPSLTLSNSTGTSDNKNKCSELEQVRTFNRMAAVALRNNNPYEAEKYLNQALIFRLQGHDFLKSISGHPSDLIYSCELRALSLAMQGQYLSAINDLLFAKDYHEHGTHFQGQCLDCNINLGVLYGLQQEPELAIKHLINTVPPSEQSSITRIQFGFEQALTWHNLGVAYHAIENLPLADACLTKARSLNNTKYNEIVSNMRPDSSYNHPKITLKL